MKDPRQQNLPHANCIPEWCVRCRCQIRVSEVGASSVPSSGIVLHVPPQPWLLQGCLSSDSGASKRTSANVQVLNLEQKQDPYTLIDPVQFVATLRDWVTMLS